MQQKLTLSHIAASIGATLHGDPSVEVCALAPLSRAGQEDISFITHKRYATDLVNTGAAAVVLELALLPKCQTHALVVSNIAAAQAKLAGLFVPASLPQAGVHPSAAIAADVQIADDVCIGAHCVIASGVSIGARTVIQANTVLGCGVQIGQDCWLHANVTCYRGVHLQDRVIIHSGAVLGADGFGLAKDQGQWLKIPQLGGVLIESDVEIGANTTVDRGTLDNTVIEQGAKLDNLIHIGHNVRIGAHTAMAGCCGVAGSTRIGRGCVIGGMVGIGDHLEIADNVMIAGKTSVAQSLKESGVYATTLAAMPAPKWRRLLANFNRLDDLFKRVKKLENKDHESV